MRSNASSDHNWKLPEKGFEVRFIVSSEKYEPEYITQFVQMEPTKIRHARHKYNLWYIEGDASKDGIQEQIDDILERIRPHAERFASLDNCHISLDVYLYLDEFKKYYNYRPGFYLDPKWIDLLSRMHAAFTLD